MPQLLRYVLACIVLLTGFALAYPFRKSGESPKNQANKSPEEEVLVLRTDDLVPAQQNSGSNSTTRGVKILDIVTSDDRFSNTLSRLPALGVADGRTQQESAQVRSLPSIDKSVKRLPSIGDYQTQPAPRREAKRDSPKRVPAVEKPAPQVKDRKPVRRYTLHRIVDGDDLKHLATSYLNNADRHLEIFELNRDVIRHPDVLPLHSDIRIPID